ncbi:PH domain-containing protein [Ferrimonas aestuarii]|uniref:YdbS-like PH domain-containing protein n=1 Tax=Ferrimonas aestuarii TaxID=2569539 RepID=A0A4U1BFS3_9GAMM|nr:PH domain-containing protein [Ferrimonas aestuarii]TKB50107.1 hypothetical protein FCL42_19630 [Ferrimonas aestuarii]
MDNSLNWQRLHPWAMVSFGARSIIDLLRNAIYLIPLLLSDITDRIEPQWLYYGVYALAGLIALSAVLKWLRFRFVLDRSNQIFRLHSGVLFRTTQAIPLDKIQNVKVAQPLLMRPTGLVNLGIETAGSQGKEAMLYALTPFKAQRLKRRLVPKVSPTTQSKNAAETEQQSPATPQESTTVTRSEAQLFAHGFFFNHLLWLMLVFGWLFSQTDQLNLVEYVEQRGWFNYWFDASADLSPITLSIQLAIAAALGYVVLSVLSGITVILKYFPYRLQVEADRLQRTGGVIARQQDILRRHKVQSLELSQSVLSRWFGVWQGKLLQVKGHSPEGQEHGSILLPFITKKSRHGDIQLLMAGETPPEKWQPIAGFWLQRRAIFITVAAAILAGIAAYQQWDELLWGLPVIYIVALLALWGSWKHYGYEFNGHRLWVKKGLLSRSWRCMPVKKWQSVKLSQSPAMRSHNLCNLKVSTASGSVTIPAIPLDNAQSIAQSAIEQVRRDHHNWL